jgi:CO dehydrogenase maturation factor
LLGELEVDGTTVLCDMEAGIGTVLRLQPGQIDLVLVVAEPTAKAIDVAARSVRIAEGRASVLVVANKVHGDGDVDLIRASLGGRDVVAVPADPLVEEADRRGVAPIDLAPDSPAVRAVTQLAAHLDGGADGGIRYPVS